MEKLKTLIVDDEAHARQALRGMLSQNFPQVEIVADVPSVPEAVKAINKYKPQVVLLDIEMPGYSGLDLLDFFEPEQVTFDIIFITAYNEYALQAFELAAIDYLLKPTRIDQLERAFERIVRKKQESRSKQYLALKENLEANSAKKIAFQTAEGLQFFPIQELLYLKADSSYTHIVFVDGTKLTVSKSLQEYNGLEDTGYFMRINRSYIINIYEIEKISKKEGGFVRMKNGDEINLSSEKRQLLYDRFGDITY
ncbi:LytR/AlgR family response regulator transcription factor [Hugenholtzia roseola]|uniref:LytR/AlgR family response regulator transcription factor n=1 Tax=Hugenholtzia roseola TaxID=1002 RepID=UPI0003F80743|nr:response regulator [Hugenholtzia roseola]